jgi:hypothetical protein
MDTIQLKDLTFKPYIGSAEIATAVKNVASSATGTIGRELGKTIGDSIGGSFGKKIGGNVGASLGRGLLSTLFK